MRNLKRALSLAVASVMLLGMMVVGTGAAYSDVTAEHNEEAIAVVTAAGIMGGTGEGFAPDKKVTRNEMAVIISNLMEYDIDEYAGAAAAFTDVPAWASKYVDAAYANGIVAGKSATTYGGEDTITNAEAGLMLMKVLGYFQFAADFGTDWKLAVITKGDEIDLYVGVDGNADTAMTRDNVAQLVLNVLESTLVSGKQTGTSANITAGEVKVEITGEVTYTAKTDKNAYDYNEVDDKDVAADLYLIEKLHGNDIVKKEENDKFGRPGYGWYNTEDDEEIVFIADKALATYAGADFDEDALEDDFDPDDWTGFGSDVYYNGSEYTGREGLEWFYGANGAVIEVYGDKDDEEIERFVAIEAYIATIAEDAIETDDDDEVVKVTITVFENGYTDGKEIEIDVEDEDHEDAYELIKGYEEEDFFMVYMAQAWDEDGAEALLDVADVETIEGEITAHKYNSSIVKRWIEIDEKKYELANEYIDAVEYDTEDEGVFYLFNDYIYMFDKDGNAADPDEFYGLVLDLGMEDGRYSDEYKYFAKIVTTEGKVEEIEVTEETTGIVQDENYEGFIVYTYNEDEEAYDIAVAGEGEAEVELTKGKTAVGELTSANSKTVFVYVDFDDEYEFDEANVYTGYKNIKSVEAEYVIAVFEEGKAAEYVFVLEGAATSSDSDDLIIVLGDDSDAIDSKKLGTYYEYSAIVAGEKTTIKTVDEITETTIFASAKVSDKGIYDFAESDLAVEGDDYHEAATDEFKKAADDVITVGGEAMAYAEDIEVFVIDEKDDSIAKGSINKNYKTDVEAVLYTLNDDDEVSALYIIKDTTEEA